MTEPAQDVLVVPMGGEHVPYIGSSFFGVMQTQPSCEGMTSSEFHNAWRDTLWTQAALGRTLVAIEPDDPGTFLGWISGITGERLLFIHVKFPFRNMGIATRLMREMGLRPDTPFRRTVETLQTRHFFREQYPESIFDPSPVL